MKVTRGTERNESRRLVLKTPNIKIKFLRDAEGTLTLEMGNSKRHHFGWPRL